MRHSPSRTVLSLDSPSLRFRTLERAPWPARHIDQDTSSEALGERHRSIRPQRSKASKLSADTKSSASGIQVDVKVAATVRKPDHISIAFTPGIRLVKTAGSCASDTLARLLGDTTLLRQEPGSNTFLCSYVCEGVQGVEYATRIRWNKLPIFYNVVQLVTVVGDGARAWVKSLYTQHLRRGAIYQYASERLFSSFSISKIQYYDSTYIRVTLSQNASLPGAATPQEFFRSWNSATTDEIRRPNGSETASPRLSPHPSRYPSANTPPARTNDRDKSGNLPREDTRTETPRSPSQHSYSPRSRLHPAHLEDPEVERRVLRLWEILS